MLAVKNKNEKIVKALLEAGANSNIQNNLGMTALMFACNIYLVEIVQLLLSHNANVHLKNSEGKSALDMVSYNKELIDLLTKYSNTNESNTNESKTLCLMDDKGNVYDPITTLVVVAVCEKATTDEFPKKKIIQYPVADIVYRSYNDELKMWSEYETHKHDQSMEIQIVKSANVKFHVLPSSDRKIKIQFKEICLPNGKKCKVQYF